MGSKWGTIGVCGGADDRRGCRGACDAVGADFQTLEELVRPLMMQCDLSTSPASNEEAASPASTI